MTITQIALLLNVQRIAERGLRYAQEDNHSHYIDLFQHTLDLVEQIEVTT